jgi:gliding motility-associated-like protein
MKKVSNVLLIFLLSTTAILAQVNLKNGLVACYPFNANAKDESGNNNNGVVNGATLTTDRFGKANSAYNFNGSSLIAVNPAQFKNQSYSFASWVNLDDLPTGGDLMSLITMGWVTSDQILSVSSSSGSNPANGFSCLGFNTGSPPISTNWTGIIPTKNTWYHVVSTRDGVSMKLYINGVLIADNSSKTSTSGTPPVYSTNSYFTIGARQNSPIPTSYYQFIKGSLDDIHLYNRPLTAAEVKALYDGSPAQTIRITTSSPTLCGGDKITFAANGASATAKYQWKVDGVNAGTDNQLLTFNTPNISAQYQVKISVEVTDTDPCFPQKPATTEQIFTLKNCVTTPSTGVDLKNGLVACYPFNANAKDETGNGNDGTVNGANLTTDRFGKANSAYKFDGNSYISVSPNQFKNQSYSYAIWVYLDKNLTGIEFMTMISIGGQKNRQLFQVGSYNNLSGYPQGFQGGGDSDKNGDMTSNSTGQIPNSGKWYHVVLVRDQISVRLYVDGNLMPNQITYNISYLTNGTNAKYSEPSYFTIGAQTDYDLSGLYKGYWTFIKGILDDIHIYNRPLTAAEVKALYDGNSPQNVTISTNKAAPCGGDKITFTANGATNTSKYQWKVDGVNQGTNSKIFVYNSVNKTADYQVKISVEVTDEDPCFPQKPVTIDKTVNVKFCTTPTANANNNILIPNAFSPNGDGTNDTWEIFNPASGNADLIVEIYNRWGELIFYSKGYSVPWDGTYKDKPVPEGTYAYIVRVDDNTVLRGVILVVR